MAQRDGAQISLEPRRTGMSMVSTRKGLSRLGEPKTPGSKKFPDQNLTCRPVEKQTERVSGTGSWQPRPMRNLFGINANGRAAARTAIARYVQEVLRESEPRFPARMMPGTGDRRRTDGTGEGIVTMSPRRKHGLPARRSFSKA